VIVTDILPFNICSDAILRSTRFVYTTLKLNVIMLGRVNGEATKSVVLCLSTYSESVHLVNAAQ
jgi:hypothetical protein